MILGEHDELPALPPGNGVAVPPAAIGGELARIDVFLTQRLDQVRSFSEIPVIPIPLPRKHGMERMMKIVVPLGIEAVSPLVARGDDSRIIEVAFRYKVYRPPKPPLLPAHRLVEFDKEVAGSQVEHAVNRINPQRVHVIFADPVQRVGDKEGPDIVAVGTVKIDGISPGSTVPVGEVVSVIPQIIPFRPKVVIDHIEDHRQPMGVTGINQLSQIFRPPVPCMGGEEIDSVVSPVPVAGKLGNGHQFNRRHPQVRQVVQPRNDRREGPFRGEGPHVKLVYQIIVQGRVAPLLVPPAESCRIHHL